MEAKERFNLLADGLLDIRAAEDFSGLKKSKLYALMQSGRLTYVKIDGSRRIPKKALVELLADNLVVRETE